MGGICGESDYYKTVLKYLLLNTPGLETKGKTAYECLKIFEKTTTSTTSTVSSPTSRAKSAHLFNFGWQSSVSKPEIKQINTKAKVSDWIIFNNKRVGYVKHIDDNNMYIDTVMKLNTGVVNIKL